MPSDDQEFPPELSQGENFIAGPLPDDETDAEPVDEAAVEARARRELLAVEAELNRRWPETRIEPSLTRISTLANLLGDPHRAYPVIHVAGTNGKSSTARMIEALLTHLGLRVGRYTSPHLQLVTERISIDGAPISAEKYVDTYRDIEPFVSMVDNATGENEPKMSKFEVLTGMAFAAFADAPVEVAVLETGLGGRWDATNIAEAQISVVTPIGLDHTDYLGDDLRSIAGEKAGIIKPGGIAVLAQQNPDVERVLLERAVEVDATVAREGSEFGVLSRDVAVGGQLLNLQGLGDVYDEIFLPLHGLHQATNAALALAAVEAFFGAGKERKLMADAVREAFASVETPGRLERVKAAPTVLLDAAHNPHGAAALASTIDEEFAFRKLVAVVGVMADKDATGILEALEPVVSEIVVTRNSSPRAMPVDELATLAVSIFGEERVTVEPVLADAIESAVALADETEDPEEPLSGGGVLITGSVVTAGEARTLFGKEPS
ncbi:bifunctional tetrahydrofolate synthase/dihydrofolate synthase [Saccharomonospora glauca]|uniref:Dihydrofolate synthase/folylpolyglutamate synthase n=1 Tax=Saccharomonospora glauca K62 TaxID=928724 RepID=I1D008_9PSEU|nr:folylpolyglutamate synthase/dihydrofolate synthase family protein [Saccharomonospora glauca]EIE98282.1 folylpolyglutamate synthase/dihydrofolate synthase [Saccharomonospora glauca K62]